MNTRFVLVLTLLLTSLSLSACGSDDTPTDAELIDKERNEVMAAKAPFALAKDETPVLSTHEWDSIFGGETGEALRYDKYGEIDELVFVALPGTPFTLQRQIRKQTRSGAETIYYKVTTPAYTSDQQLWVDGRFLDLQDVRPPEKTPEYPIPAKTLVTLRSYEGSPYTWHGTSKDGVPELLEFYPAAEALSDRSKGDWALKGFDSLGMLYQASGGRTPLDLKSLARFGEAVFVDTSTVTDKDENGNVRDTTVPKAKLVMAGLKPLDIISMGDRLWVVLDNDQVLESKYRSKFDGSVQSTTLYDTLVGLFQKGTYVKDPSEELENKDAKKFFIRRYPEPEKVPEPTEEEIPNL